MAVKIKDPNYALIPEPTVRAFRELRQAVEGAISQGGGGVTDHGALAGLSDDDHPQYLTEGRASGDYVRRDGTLPLAGDWDAGAHTIRAEGLGVRTTVGALKYRWVYNEALDTLDLEYVP